MADGSKPPHKFTNLCREFMWLTAKTLDGTTLPLFDAVIPIVSGTQSSSTVVTYWKDNKEAVILMKTMKCSIASWFFGYWTKICQCKLGMIKKLMESFDTDAAKLAGYSKFDAETMEVHTRFVDIDEQLDGIDVEMGINQCWEADLEEDGSNSVDVVGLREAFCTDSLQSG